MNGLKSLPLKDPDLLRQAMLIDGQWVQADDGGTIEVRNPASGELIARVPNGGAAETCRAIDAAERAMKGWRKTLPRERANILRRLYDLMLAHIEDLAVIMTPADTVPGLIEELGAKGTRAALVLSAGLTEQNGLRQKMLDAAQPHLLRVIGPNCIGLALPHAGLNAGFFHMAPPRGDIALNWAQLRRPRSPRPARASSTSALKSSPVRV